MASIGSSSSSILLLLLLLLVVVVGGDMELIQKTCRSTKHYQLCVSSLESNAASLKVADPKGLAIIMIGVGVANATATSLYLISSSSSSISNHTMATIPLLQQCAHMYGYAADALQACVEDLDNYDYAYMHLMAASDYPNACHNSFTLHQLALLYPPQLAYREQAFLHICDVVFGIITALS